MNRPQLALLQLLSRSDLERTQKLDRARFAQRVHASFAELQPTDWSDLFIASTFLVSASQSLADEHWLQRHNQSEQGRPTAKQHQDAFATFVHLALQQSLAPLAFLGSVLENPDVADLKSLGLMGEIVLREIVQLARESSDANYREFTALAMHQMAELAQSDSRHALSATHPTFQHSLYRTFDAMDEILGLDYQRDAGMDHVQGTTERLYEGAGVGVQSSYSTILIALKQIQPSRNSRFIDLGSGYGRVGFVVGFLRPDIEFIGYEYVDHRVEVSQASAERAGLSSHVQFLTQDLAARDFVIPEAEVYYLYDPFSEETYQHVFKQLRAIGERRAITVATKGNAGAWFAKAASGTWTVPETFDTGTLGLFHSQPN